MGNVPDLEERFLEPTGWQWVFFEHNGRMLRFGSVAPSGSPRAIVVCLPGLGEFCEKYFETARDMLAQGYAFYVLDWTGQGKSSRYLSNPHKRHSNGFQNDIDDLHELVLRHIQPANSDGAPLIMLAHSMGANIGTRYLQQHPEVFTCAALSAPMYGVQALSVMPMWFQLCLTRVVSLFSGRFYIPGATDWSENIRSTLGDNHLSSDPKRNALYNQWSIADKDLRVGNITYGWLYHAIYSCTRMSFETIQTHCLIASAGKEEIIDNKAINTAAKLLPNATHIVLPDARHEILMESDAIRGRFLTAFYQLIKETTNDC